MLRGFVVLKLKNMHKTKHISMDFAFPVAILLMLTFILSVMNADLLLAARFYSPAEGWPWKNAHPWIDLYHYGNIPPLMLGLYGLIVFIFSFFVRRIASSRLFRTEPLFMLAKLMTMLFLITESLSMRLVWPM